MLNLIPPQWMIAIKIACVAILMAISSYITWQVAMSDIKQERLEVAQQQLVQEKANTAYWLEQVNNQRNKVIEAESQKQTLDTKLKTLTREYKNAKPLPSDCTIDDVSVLYIETARKAAISTARGIADN